MTDCESPQLSEIALGIVCPMANEGAEAPRFVTAVLEACSEFKSIQFFAVLDRASQDDTLELLRELYRSTPALRVVWAPENTCVVDAYVRGYREAIAARCDWILEIDAGFSHQPADLRRFFATMAQGYDCVFGSRFMSGGRISESSWKRRLVSRGGTILANLTLGTKLTDMTSGFELFSRNALEMVLQKGIRSRAHFFQTEVKFHCRGLRITEVPIRYRAASPRLRWTSIQESFAQLWRLYRSTQRNQT